MKYRVSVNIRDKQYDYQDLTSARKKAYAIAKANQKNEKQIWIERVGKHSVRWRDVWCTTLANGKRYVVITTLDNKTMHILKSDGTLCRKVHDMPVVRNGRYVGNMFYVEDSPPTKGLFYNYDTSKMDTYIAKKKKNSPIGL